MKKIHARFYVERPDFRLAVDLTLPARGVSALFGHSGSGKTTLLRAIAGLERAAQGYCAIGDTVWQDSTRGLFVPTHQRALGYVFQEASLFEHLNVADNLDYGRRRLKAGPRQLDPAAILNMLGIAHLLDRRPDKLSGGERQRVAIARALFTEPQLLLMDEPLASLDLKRKLEILPYLERLRDHLALPILYVSHAPDEVARLADHLVLLDGGRAIASGPLAETLARTDLPDHITDDVGVVLEARLAAQAEDGLSRLDFAGGHIWVSQRSEAIGQALRCRIFARDVSLARQQPTETSILNIFTGRITDIAPTATPGHVLVGIELPGSRLIARITERSRRSLDLQAGQTVWAQAKAVSVLA